VEDVTLELTAIEERLRGARGGCAGFNAKLIG
jgi:hypothetical protein